MSLFFFFLLTCCAWTVNDKPWQTQSGLWVGSLGPNSEIDHSQKPENHR